MKYWKNTKTGNVGILSRKPSNEPWAYACGGEWMEISEDEYNTISVYRDCLLGRA